MARSLIVALAAALVLAAPASASRLTKADRTAINHVFDVFVPSAVERQRPAASYDLVTAQFRGGATRAQWASGNIPVFPYKARGRTFHGWTVDYIQGNEVAFELMLQPRSARGDAIAFDGSIKKIRGRWLIDSFNPSATFAGGGGAKVVGPNDFTARGLAGDAGDSRLSAIWWLLPGGVLALILLVPLAFAIASWRRGRNTAATEEERRRYDEFWERLRTRSSAG